MEQQKISATGFMRLMPFFCLDTKETKNQGTGLLLDSETIHLIQLHINRTIWSPPEPLFCRWFFNYLQKNAAQFGAETEASKCRNYFLPAPWVDHRTYRRVRMWLPKLFYFQHQKKYQMRCSLLLFRNLANSNRFKLLFETAHDTNWILRIL